MTRKDAIYIGVFTSNDSLHGNLFKDIPDKHVTLVFKPTEEQFLKILPILGENVSVVATAYGNDGKNEGLMVSLPDYIPYYGNAQPHITLSVAEDGKPVNTGKLAFNEPVPANIDTVLMGQVAVFTGRQLITNPQAFEEYEALFSEIIDGIEIEPQEKEEILV